MLTYPEIDPVMASIGPIKVHWYGMMYLIGFVGAWTLGTWRAKQPNSGWTGEQVADMITWLAFGVIIGGRLGHVIFYEPSKYLADPLEIFMVQHGGMAFHGGFIGVLVAGWLFGKRHNKTFFELMDFVAPLVPIGLAAGRLGNFINGELWGRATDVPWAMVFPKADSLARHPSQLYEMFLEGIVLFIVLWWVSSRRQPRMLISGLFAMLYGIFRFSVEFVREPDGEVFFGWLTTGQVLSTPMILLGAALIYLAYRRQSALGVAS